MDSDTLALLYFIVILLIIVNGSRAAAPEGDDVLHKDININSIRSGG